MGKNKNKNKTKTGGGSVDKRIENEPKVMELPDSDEEESVRKAEKAKLTKGIVQ